MWRDTSASDNTEANGDFILISSLNGQSAKTSPAGCMARVKLATGALPITISIGADYHPLQVLSYGELGSRHNGVRLQRG